MTYLFRYLWALIKGLWYVWAVLGLLTILIGLSALFQALGASQQGAQQLAGYLACAVLIAGLAQGIYSNVKNGRR